MTARFAWVKSAASLCGIFGFLASGDHGPDLKQLRQIARITERRGPHAFGWAWIDGEGLRSFKTTGRISDSLPLLAMLQDARLIIGHTRWATAGDPADNINNHPHPVDGGWLVHNGVIGTYERLIDERELYPSSECDSEVLGLLMEQIRGSLLERAIAAVKLCGRAPLAMLGLWSRPDRLIVIRSGNPLSRGEDQRGTYLASLPEGLPGDVQEVPDHTGISFRYRCGRLEETVRRCGRVIRAAGLPSYVR